MNQFFTSMLPFEIVLLIMGVIIFLVLTFLLIWNTLKTRKIVPLLPFFLIPVVLVGYPSVQSIAFKDDGLSIQKYTQAVKENPADTASVNALTDKLDQFQSNPSRIKNNPGALITIAGAQLALGKLDSAASTVSRASRIAPQSNTVKRTEAEINQHLVVRQAFRTNISLLSNDLKKLQSSPGDTEVTGHIAQVLSTLNHPTYVDASSALLMAKALAVMNQPARSVEMIDQVLSADTASREARQLKTEILSGRISVEHQATSAQQKVFQKNLIAGQKPFKAVLKDN